MAEQQWCGCSFDCRQQIKFYLYLRECGVKIAPPHLRSRAQRHIYVIGQLPGFSAGAKMQYIPRALSAQLFLFCLPHLSTINLSPTLFYKYPATSTFTSRIHIIHNSEHKQYPHPQKTWPTQFQHFSSSSSPSFYRPWVSSWWQAVVPTSSSTSV